MAEKVETDFEQITAALERELTEYKSREAMQMVNNVCRNIFMNNKIIFFCNRRVLLCEGSSQSLEHS